MGTSTPSWVSMSFEEYAELVNDRDFLNEISFLVDSHGIHEETARMVAETLQRRDSR